MKAEILQVSSHQFLETGDGLPAVHDGEEKALCVCSIEVPNLLVSPIFQVLYSS